MNELAPADATFSSATMGDEAKLFIKMTYKGESRLIALQVKIGIYDERCVAVLGLDSDLSGGLGTTLPEKGQIICVTDEINLNAGPCNINIALFSAGSMVDYVQSAASFDTSANDFYNTDKKFRHEAGRFV